MSDGPDLPRHRIFAGLPLLEGLFSGSTVGLALLDTELRFVWVNQTLADLNGVSVEEHRGRRLHEVVPHVADAAAPAFEKVLSDGEPLIDWELSGETAAMPGQTRYWLENVYPLREGGTIVGLGAVVLDITERKLAEQRLARAEQRASELLRQLQAGLVPQAKIDERWKLAWRYQASEDTMLLGGDFLGILERPEGSLALLIGDVAGRGATAAGVGTMLRSAWLASIYAGISLEETAMVLDRLLEGQVRGRGMFATACFAQIDLSPRELRIISAGHDPPLLITAGSAMPVAIDTGPALGLGRPRDWSLQRVQIPTESALLLYTDGLTESRHRRSSPRLGVDGLLACIDSHRLLTQPAEQALDQLLKASLPGEIHELVDDLAVILVTLD